MKNESVTSEYRSIFKSFTLFGGIQILVILLGILRTKTIAVTVGPVGVGTLSMFTTIITLWYSVINLGVSSSSVKLLSENSFLDNKKELSKTLFTLNRLTFLTAIVGALLFALFSGMFSVWSFGNTTYQVSFILLSVVIVAESYNNRNQSVLQAFRRLKFLGMSSFVGNLFGTLISVFLFCYFGESAIVPSLVILYFANYLSSQFCFTKCKTESKTYTYAEVRGVVSNLVRMGVAMTISSIMVYGSAYLIRLYIVYQSGSLADVGYYQAGWAIVNGYVGLIFTAMGKDYYPRLAAINNDNTEVVNMANKQIEFGLLIMIPIIVVFIAFIQIIVSILYTSDFHIISTMMLWSLIGMYFKLLSWCIGYIFLAKGLAKWFIIYEVIGSVITIVSSILFYKIGGLDGLGIAFLFSNFLYFFMIYLISKEVLLFRLTRLNSISLLLAIFISLIALTLMRIELNSLLRISILTFLIGSTITVALLRLNSRLKFFK